MLGYTNVSPDLATEILNQNTWNRTLYQSDVDKITRDIKAGDWKKNGATIVIASNRALLDGQHRRWAVVESGITVPMILIRDADPDCVVTIDTGRPRSYADYKKLSGNATGNPVMYSRDLQAVLKLIYWYQMHWPKMPNGVAMKATHSELDDLLGAHPQLPDLIPDAVGVQAIKRLGAQNQIAFVYGLACERYPNEARAWLDVLKHGEAAKNNPARFLRETIIARRLGNAPLDLPTKIVYIIKSWNAFAQGVDIGSLRWAPDEPIPAIYGTKNYTGKMAAHSAIALKRKAATTKVERIAANAIGKRRRRPKTA